MKAFLRILFLTTLVSVTLSEDSFDLSDALDDDIKPTPKAAKPKDSGDGFDLFDALGPDPKTVKPPVKPPSGGGGGGHFGDSDLLDNNKPDGGRPAGGGGFSDTDLVDNYKPDGGRSGGGNDYDTHGNADQPEAKAGSGQIAGIVSAVGVAILGAASSYFAYQKKKLCFKIQGGQDPEKAQRGGTHSEPQVFSTLLQTN